MQVKFDSNFLVNYLNRINKLILNRDSNAYFPPSFFINVSLQKMLIRSYSSNIYCRINIDIDNKNIEVIEPGEFLIKNHPFIDLLRKINDNKIEINKVESKIATIKANTFQSNLNLLDAENFMIINKKEADNSFEMKAYEFKKLLKEIQFVVNHQEKRAVLRGLNFEFNEESINVVATDSFRLSQKKINKRLKNKNGNLKNIIIPARILNEIDKIIVNQETIIKFEIVNNRELNICFEDFELQVKLIEGQYPNIKNVIPKEFSRKLLINRRDLIHSISRASVISDNYQSKIITFKINKSETKIISSTPEIGESKEIITNKNFDGEDIEISFNHSYIYESLNAFDCEIISILMNGRDKPIILKNNEKDNMLQMVLPVRVF